MYILDGIAYAGDPGPQIRVSGVRPLDQYRLWVRFTNGKAKTYDMKPLLDFPAFERLKNEETFRQVYVDYGSAVWCDGEIDIAAKELYEKGQ